MKYALSQRLLHWIIALMVLGALAVGVLLGFLGFSGVKDAFGIDITNLLYKYHKTFGVLILGLMIIRIIVKMANGVPDYAQPLTKFEYLTSNAVHGLLYLCLFAMPVLGWLGTGANGFPVEFFNWKLPPILTKDKELGGLLMDLHGIVGWTLAALIAIHIGAALKHAIVKKDGVLQRML